MKHLVFCKKMWNHAISMIIFGCILMSVGEKLSYEGFSLLRVTPITQPQLQLLLRLNSNTSSGLDFWLRSTAVNHSADIMVYPWAKQRFLSELQRSAIPHEVLISDLGQVIEDDLNMEVVVPAGLEFFSCYRSVEEIIEFMENLANDFSSNVEILEIGSSFEGKTLSVIRIFTESENDKPAIWIQGGAHSREMIGPATVLYIAFKLASSCKTNRIISEIVEAFDWYLLPVVNPDGYEYARTTDRLWRKTRSKYDNSDCVGVDANRNWDFHWSGSGGASTNPCSHNYAGPSPFSESETRSIAEYMRENLDGQLHIFLDFHSYSQRWLTPWGYTSKLPSNYKEQKELAEVAAAALNKAYGTKYSIGSSGNIMYTVTGGARDWVHGVMEVPYSYVIELRDKGARAFLLPRIEILPTVEESWEGVKAMAKTAAVRLRANT